MIKHDFCICEEKAQMCCPVSAQLMSAFVFATWIVHSLCFLNPFKSSVAAVWFVLDLIGKTEDRFSCEAVQLELSYVTVWGNKRDRHTPVSSAEQVN